MLGSGLISPSKPRLLPLPGGTANIRGLPSPGPGSRGMSLTGRAQVSQPSLDGFAGRWRAPAVSNLSPSKQPDPNVGRLAGTLPQGLSTGLLSGGGLMGLAQAHGAQLVAGGPQSGGGSTFKGIPAGGVYAGGPQAGAPQGDGGLISRSPDKTQGDTGTPAWKMQRRRPLAESQPNASTAGPLQQGASVLAQAQQQEAAKQAAYARAKPFDVGGQSVSPYGGWQL